MITASHTWFGHLFILIFIIVVFVFSLAFDSGPELVSPERQDAAGQGVEDAQVGRHRRVVAGGLWKNELGVNSLG